MADVASLCYLCGKALADSISSDHVPPKQFYADDVRKEHQLNLLTIPVHKNCNQAYQLDEDYFANTLAPLAHDSYSGNAFLREVSQKYEVGEKRGLVDKIRREFESRPSGLVLPQHYVLKRIEGNRVRRVTWKIVRGLYFHRFDKVLPEDAPYHLQLVPPNQRPPEEFFALASAPSYGQYPGVFDYRFATFAELNCWAMLLWDRIIFFAIFHDPSCECERCSSSRSRLRKKMEELAKNLPPPPLTSRSK